jgi:YD repeat-containing protein
MRTIYYKSFCTYILCVIIISKSINSFAQGTNADSYTPNVIPPSPNAASLGKYGEIPVSLYTGIPNISVPIWEVKEGDITVPISFSYHASGVRVEETASWVGLGWSLNAGGVITRSVRGKPDEEGYFNTSCPKLPNLLLDQSAAGSQCDILSAAQYCKNVVDGITYYDSEPDMYFFNFNGIQGKFVFDQSGVPYTIPFQKIKIERNVTVGTTLYKWLITTSDGMKYKFLDTEVTTAYSVKYAYDNQLKLQEYSEFTKQINNPHESAWYLKEIESPSGRKVTFNYADETFENRSGISERRAYQLSNGTELNQHRTLSGEKTQVLGKRLQEIRFSNGVVLFVANKVRDDLGNLQAPVSKALDKIVIADVNSVPIKNFVLATDYFQSATSNIGYFTKRLKLLSITEFNTDLTKSLPPHLFTYEEQNSLPPRDAVSQDHWGFSNGKDNKNSYDVPTLIPSFYRAKSINFNHLCDPADLATSNGSSLDCFGKIVGTNYTTTQPFVFNFQGADRNFDFNFAKSGVLKKITYPTGGFTDMEFELHDFELSDYIYKQFVSDNTIGANCSEPSFNGQPILRNTDNGGSCYQKLQLTPSNTIPAAQLSLNPTVSFDFTFLAELNGFSYSCCDNCFQPEGYLKDITSNKILISYGGLSGIVFDISVTNQINSGTVQYSNNAQGTPFPAKPSWILKNLRLDPTHTYEINAQTQNCQSCTSQPSCTNGVPRLGSYIQAKYYYQTNEVAEYNGTLGGLRIKKITSYNNTTDLKPVIKKYNYRLLSNDKISSGVVNELPVYFENLDRPNSITIGFANVVVSTNNDQKSVVSLSSGSKFELGQTNGSYIGYKEVQEIACQDGDCLLSPQGKKVFTYFSAKDYQDINSQTLGVIEYNEAFAGDCQKAFISKPIATSLVKFANYYPYAPKTSFDWKRGLLKSETYVDNTNIVKRKTETIYNTLGDVNNRKIISGLKVAHAPLWERNKITSSTAFEALGGPIQFVWNTEYAYARYDIIAEWNYTTQQKVTEYDNSGNAITTIVGFLYDNPTYAQLTSQTKTTSKGETMKMQYKYPYDYTVEPYLTMKNKYIFSPIIEETTLLNNVQIAQKSTDYATFGSIQLPSRIRTKARNYAEQTQITFDSYDGVGNLTSYTPINGLKNILTYYTTTDIGKVNLLKTQTNNLGHITTYDYLPLVGLSLITDPNGRTSSYTYDSFNRLSTIKDPNGKIIKSYQYNFYNQ